MRRRNAMLLAIASSAFSGCTRAPSINILGAYFPDWIFCISASVVLAIGVHLALKSSGRLTWAYPAAIVYPALVALMSLIGWLIFFEH